MRGRKGEWKEGSGGQGMGGKEGKFLSCGAKNAKNLTNFRILGLLNPPLCPS